MTSGEVCKAEEEYFDGEEKSKFEGGIVKYDAISRCFQCSADTRTYIWLKNSSFRHQAEVR